MTFDVSEIIRWDDTMNRVNDIISSESFRKAIERLEKQLHRELESLMIGELSTVDINDLL